METKQQPPEEVIKTEKQSPEDDQSITLPDDIWDTIFSKLILEDGWSSPELVALSGVDKRLKELSRGYITKLDLRKAPKTVDLVEIVKQYTNAKAIRFPIWVNNQDVESFVRFYKDKAEDKTLLNSLKELDLSSCDQLTYLPVLPESLKKLSLLECNKLENKEFEKLSNLINLKELNLWLQ
jgi:hypothetical protein